MAQLKQSYWICCQLGAREHYAIPRSLHHAGQLYYLITDAWVSPTLLLNKLPHSVLTNLRERYHEDISQARIQAFTNSLMTFEITQQITKQTKWQKNIARNNWFQRQTVNFFKSISAELKNIQSSLVVFSYSYSSLEIFRYAKSQGWITVLGQIDPGLTHEKIVIQEYKKYPQYHIKLESAPSYYWKNWYKECILADLIIANSSWSSQALQQLGIAQDKIKIIPLAYEIPKQVNNFQRKYPIQFSYERPLKVLFLGNIVPNKGILYLLEATKLLKEQPIEFLIVGSLGIPKPLAEDCYNVKWIGAVPRSITANYYQQADIFIFPTLSDGFGLTQLEANAWQLPIIASRFCGEVVENGVNGLILAEVTSQEIAKVLSFCLNNPQELERFSRNSGKLEDFSLANLQDRLLTLKNPQD